MSKKILIVDDEHYIRMLLEETLEELEDEGVELLISSNGDEALEIIKEEKPELVFLDIMMPKMNGFDVCYIIMLTAKGQEFDKQKGQEVGADMYMTKPFDPDDVVEKALEILGLD